MTDKPYEIVDGKIYPRKAVKPNNCSNEISGSHWRIWKEESKCFLEFDEGHFGTKMVTVEITESEYDAIVSRPSTVNEVILAKQRGS